MFIWAVVLLLVIAAVSVCFFCIKKRSAKEHSSIKVKGLFIAMFTALAVLFLPVLALWLVAAMSGLKLHLLIPLAGIMLVVLASYIAFGIENNLLNKKNVFCLSFAAVFMACSVLAERYYRFTYIPSITLTQHNAYHRQYLPFRDSPYLMHTDSAPSLQFASGETLPVVDGATALVPVYCSVVENVYPRDITPGDFVLFGTTKGAYEELTAGNADVIFVAQPSKEQIEKAAEAGITFNLYPIGYEAFVFLVNSKNPVESLSVQQIKGIYTGKITGWQELGGKNQSIRPFQRDADSGSQTAFVSIMGADAELLPPETHQVTGMEGLVDVVSDYENHSNAIGYSFRYYVENMKHSENVKMLKINGVAPTKENICNHSYPFTDNFYAVTVQGRETENTRRLVEWVCGAQGQELIEKVGYVPLGGVK